MSVSQQTDDSFSLQQFQEKFFAHRALILASNRGPVTFNYDETGALQMERGEGGLVTALIGLCHHAEATWIAAAQTEADRAWGQGVVPLNGQASVQIHFVQPDPAAYDGYYNVVANPLLWFLQHSMWDVPLTPIINRNTWQAWHAGYVAVNRLFAEAIVKQVRANPQPTLVMLQDYHLYLVPRFIRQALKPEARPTILHFTHIPWPGPEYWGILPPVMRAAIFDGLAGADLLGFQTQNDALNFLRTCAEHLPGRVGVKYNKGRLWFRNHTTYVRDFPISIDVDALRQTARSPEVHAYKKDLEDIVGDYQLILRVDRLEPSKNIVRGFQAYEEMLDLYPEHRERVKFLTLLVPSRLGVDEYQDYLAALMAEAGRINAKYGGGEWEPVRVLVGQNYPRAVAAMQRYDVLLVNSIADGMNLVAKEGPIVNQRDGMLVLSDQTGARQQLAEGAIVISPCDVYATAEALHQALTMPRPQRQEAAQHLRSIVEEQDISAWLYQQLRAVHTLHL